MHLRRRRRLAVGGTDSFTRFDSQPRVPLEPRRELQPLESPRVEAEQLAREDAKIIRLLLEEHVLLDLSEAPGEEGVKRWARGGGGGARATGPGARGRRFGRARSRMACALKHPHRRNGLAVGRRARRRSGRHQHALVTRPTSIPRRGMRGVQWHAPDTAEAATKRGSASRPPSRHAPPLVGRNLRILDRLDEGSALAARPNRRPLSQHQRLKPLERAARHWRASAFSGPETASHHVGWLRLCGVVVWEGPVAVFSRVVFGPTNLQTGALEQLGGNLQIDGQEGGEGSPSGSACSISRE
eukprot:scaffold8849_cov101-Isochrysis_galbana.AAC.5